MTLLFHRKGFGLHSGAPSEARVVRVASSNGLFWNRTRLGPQSALLCDGILSTTLHDPTQRSSLATVEHWLAAFVGLGVGGLSIHNSQNTHELPAIDGCAMPLACALKEHTLPALPRWAPPHPLHIHTPHTRASWSPPSSQERNDSLYIHYSISFPNCVIQDVSLQIDLSDPYETLHQILPARTFTVAQDLAQVRARQRQGIGAGLRSGQALVAGPHSWLHGAPLRWPDEPVRHKILDLLGDLGTLGIRPCGHLRISNGGHATHRALARAASPWLRSLRT